MPGTLLIPQKGPFCHSRRFCLHSTTSRCTQKHMWTETHPRYFR